MDFPVQEDYRVKMKKSKKNTSTLNEWWNMCVTVTPLVVGALGIVSKGFERRLEELEVRRKTELYRLQHC